MFLEQAMFASFSTLGQCWLPGKEKNLNASVKGAGVERGTSSSCPQKFGEGCIQSIILSKRVIKLHWIN